MSYNGPERRSKQPAFTRALNSVKGVIGVLAVVATVSATTALSAQRFIGMPATNARQIAAQAIVDSTHNVRLHSLEDRAGSMETQHVDIYREIRRLGVILCASLGDPNSREVRVACAALRNGQP
jgi:hypothetical protein